MMKYSRIALPLLCIALLVAAGCAKPRTGPFDVPAAVPSGMQGAASSAPATAGSGSAYPSAAYSATTGAAKGAAAEIESLKIYFAFDRATLTAEAQQTLNRLGALLKQNPSIRISIQGHCDVRGGRHYNFDLGDRRARAAYGYLVQNGVNPDQLTMVTYGKGTPAVSGSSESTHARNRRDEFIVLTTCR
ncbi:OmpA family protein [Desulfovibrio sp. OttesenSCG-928-O18]|nr:OmpA family protein [Desulfovibrio sp. OttesenSCG-928-O18]